MGERLIIVSSKKPNLYDYLSRQLTEDVRILLDRRRGERRHEVHQREGTERRQADRRRQPGIISHTDWFVLPRGAPLSAPVSVPERASRRAEHPLRTVALVARAGGR
jgi:hypothetical protein